MKRKLVRQGKTTLMVSLPNNWVKRNNLQKGAEVSLNEDNNNILISTEQKKIRRKTVITLTSDTEPSVRTAIINAYRSGYDIIRINFKNKNQHILIDQIINSYAIGLEMTKIDKLYCILESITEPEQQRFDVVFRRIFYNVQQLLEFTSERLKGKEQHINYENIVLKIHCYDNFCRRVISKRNEPSYRAGLYWSFLGLISQAQRELYHLNIFLNSNKVIFKNEKLFGHFKEVIELISSAYAKKNLEEIEKVHDLKKKIKRTLLYPLMIKGRNEENIVISHLVTSLRLFHLTCSPLTGLILKPEKITWE